MKIRVLTISKPYVGLTYRDKLKKLAEEGRFDIGLICPFAWGAQSFEADTGNCDENYWIKTLPIRLNGHNHFHSYKNLEAAIGEFKPAILNVEEEHYSLVTFQAYRIAVKMGIRPIFYTWQNINKVYPPPFSWIEKYVFRHSAGAVAGNEEAAEILRKKGYKGPLRVIPQMGVDYESFRPADTSLESRSTLKSSLGLDEKKFWVLFAGRIVKEKGIIDLLQAIKQIDDSKLAVLIVGSGPDLTDLKRQAEDLVALGRVKFISQVESSRIPSYLQAVDVMCLPSWTESNWKEQFGRIIIESMAAEAVVVGSSSGEIPNVIGNAGLIFEERNSESLADALRKLLENPKLCLDIRKRATARFQSHFKSSIIAQKFGDFFAEVSS